MRVHAIFALFVYIFPLNRLLIISRAVIRVVWYMVGTSRVEVRLSANPNGSMSGIQPESKFHPCVCASVMDNTHLERTPSPTSRGPYRIA